MASEKTGKQRESMDRKHSRRVSGSVITEFALMIPLLMLIFVGTVDFSRLFYAAVTATDGARAGVAYGSISNGKASDTPGMEAAANANATDLTAKTPGARKFCYCPGTTTEVDCISTTCGTGVVELYVEVTMASTFTTLVDFPGIPDSVALAEKAIFRVQ